MNSKKTVLALLLTGLAASCGPTLYIPKAEHITEGTTLARLMQGRELYVAKCASCHTLKSPSEYPVGVWKENLDEMQTRARITDAEKELMLEYLAAGSTPERHSLQLQEQTPIFVKRQQQGANK